MFMAGMVLIAALVCGTVMVVTGTGSWYILWPVLMSVYFAILYAGAWGTQTRKPWPKREE